MAKILQPTFIISDEIAAGLASGALKRTGGVIRNRATGEIVEHLKDGLARDTISEVAPKAAASAATKSVGLSTTAKVGIGALVIAVVVGVAYGGYKLYGFIKKKKETGNNEDQVELIGYNPEITEYLNATKNKTMSFDKIVGVVKFFELYSSGKDLNIEITDNELLTMRNIFVKYAIALSETNKLKEPNLNLEAKSQKREDLLEEALIALRYQEDIFKNEK